MRRYCDRSATLWQHGDIGSWDSVKVSEKWFSEITYFTLLYFTYFIHTQTRIPSCPGQHSPHTNCEYIRVFAMFFPPVNQESRWCSLTLNTSKISWDCDIELLLCLFLHQSNFPRCIDVLLARVLVAIYYFSGTFCRLGSIWAGRPKSREYGLQSPSNKRGGGGTLHIYLTVQHTILTVRLFSSDQSDSALFLSTLSILSILEYITRVNCWQDAPLQVRSFLKFTDTRFCYFTALCPSLLGNLLKMLYQVQKNPNQINSSVLVTFAKSSKAR